MLDAVSILAMLVWLFHPFIPLLEGCFFASLDVPFFSDLCSCWKDFGDSNCLPAQKQNRETENRFAQQNAHTIILLCFSTDGSYVSPLLFESLVFLASKLAGCFG